MTRRDLSRQLWLLWVGRMTAILVAASVLGFAFSLSLPLATSLRPVMAAASAALMTYPLRALSWRLIGERAQAGGLVLVWYRRRHSTQLDRDLEQGQLTSAETTNVEIQPRAAVEPASFERKILVSPAERDTVRLGDLAIGDGDEITWTIAALTALRAANDGRPWLDILAEPARRERSQTSPEPVIHVKRGGFVWRAGFAIIAPVWAWALYVSTMRPF